MTPAPANYASPLISFLVMISGLLLLLGGGEALIAGASRLAKRLGMSSLLIGLTVVAFGTSMPELFVSLKATVQGHPDIMLGNVVGSNIANIGLVLAFSALLAPIPIIFQRMAKEFYLVIGASAAVFGSAVIGIFHRPLGVIFAATLIGYTYFSYRAENRLIKTNGPKRPNGEVLPPYWLVSFLCLFGLICMWFGSDFFINGAVDLARILGLSELVIGLTLAAVGTSLPELASCIAAVRKKENDILVGNILGSNLFNLLLVLGLTAVIKPFSLPHNALYRDLPVMVFFTVILVPIALFNRCLERWHAILLLLAYGLYIYLLA